jgi:hypothetical protein
MVSHPVVVRAPRALASQPGPLLLGRSDARFMDGVRRELGDPSQREALLGSVVKAENGALQLYQPIHRVFHLAVVEASCKTFGEPRLDPRKVESAGLVVRRIARGGGEQGWMRARDAVRGWVDLEPEASAAQRLSRLTLSAARVKDDPDVGRRRGLHTHPSIVPLAARLRLAPSALSEDVTDLFVLPPDVCTAAQATLFYGLVPTASLDAMPAPPAAEFAASEVLEDLPQHLKSRGTLQNQGLPVPSVPQAGGWVPRPVGPITDASLRAYAEFVERVVAEYDLLGDTPGGARLRSALDGIRVRFDDDGSSTLTAHLEQAARVLVFGPPAPGTADPHPALRMPREWPEITGAQEAEIVGAVADALRAQFQRLVSHEGRFSDAEARYVVRAFVRVRRDDGCPPELYWSEPSPEFQIAPWYVTGPGPTPVVPLPDPFKGLGQFKPNVAFSLPPAISDIVHRNTPEKLLEGKGSRGGGLGLGWLCGFNIPLITLCAFIVLSIFLSLFNIIFWWLAFIRICIPIPKRQ